MYIYIIITIVYKTCVCIYNSVYHIQISQFHYVAVDRLQICSLDHV